MLLRVTNQYGSGFTVYARRDILDRVREDYQFMGYTVRNLR